MAQPRVLLTQTIPEIGITMLQEKCQVTIHAQIAQNDPTPLNERIRSYDALLCLLTDTIDAELIEAGSKLKVISNYAVGFDNIDVAYATNKGIPVTNTPGVLTTATAELAWTLIFALCRHIVQADVFVRAGKFKSWDPHLFLGYEVTGKTLGIIGLGRIGQAVARMATGFSMDILYYDTHPSDLPADLPLSRVSLTELARQSDIISVHVPLSDETYHLCDQAFFEQCQQQAIFVNTARGPVVDEVALNNALDQGRIAGAGLDVYEHEPKIYPPLLGKKNVVLAPHIGSATFQTRAKMAQCAAQNVLDVLQGKRPQFLVNPEVY